MKTFEYLPKKLFFVIFFSCIVTTFLGILRADERQEQGTPGITWISEPPVVKLTADFMTAQQLLEYSCTETLNRGCGIRSPQGVGLTFLAMTRLSSPFVDTHPPDTMGAAGPTQFIAATNNGIRSFNKTTGIADNVLNINLTTFFTASTQAFDPQIRYDTFSGRWFIHAITRGAPNQVLIAVSSTSTITPTTTWNFYRIVQDTMAPVGDFGCFADFGALGIDVHAVYIPIIMECTTPPTARLTIFVFQKSALVAGIPAVVTAFRNIFTTNNQTEIRRGSLRGVDNFDPAPTFGYVIAEVPSTLNPFNQLHIYRIINPGSPAPTLGPSVQFAVSPFGIPLNAPHLGAINFTTWLSIGIGPTGLVEDEALRDRIMNAHIRDNQLWACHMIGVDQSGTPNINPLLNDRDAIRWYQLDVTGGGPELPATVPTIIQEGTLFDPAVSNPRFFSMPSLMTDTLGNMALSGTVCSAVEFINAFTTGRRVEDPLNTLRSPIRMLTNSTASYNAFGSQFGTRWGDYSYTSNDPINGTLWTIQEYTAAINDYGLIVVNLTTPPNVAPVALNGCENTPLNGVLTATDGVPPYVFIVTNPVNGTVLFDANTGAFTFTPTPGFIGIASFDYQAIDSNGGVSNVATVTITVLPAPTASNGVASTCANAPLIASVAPLVSGGTPPYTFAVDTTTTQGILVLNPVTGGYTYTPNGIFTGIDSFTFHATGANGCASNIATVTITVFQVPVTTSGPLLEACQNTLFNGTLAPLVSLGTPPYTFLVDVTTPNGVLVVNPVTGTFTYMPNLNYVGPDSFIYHVTDANGCVSNSSMVNIFVNQTPVAINDLIDVCRSLFISSSLAPLVSLGTPPYIFAVVAGPTNGTLTSFNSITGDYTYTPTPGFTGADSFNYQVTDTKGCKSNIATVNFNVVVPGLTIVKTDSPNPVNAGSNITYIITISNTGPCDIQLVSFVDTVPANTTFVSFVQNPIPGDPPFVLSAPPVGFTGNIQGNINTLAVGQSAQFTFVVNVNSNVPTGSVITNTVTATGTTPPVTVSSTTMTTVNRFANLVITKTAGCTSTVLSGNQFQFLITITNNGPSDITGLFLSDPAPPTANLIAFPVQQFGSPLTITPSGFDTGFTASGNLPAGKSTFLLSTYSSPFLVPMVNTVTTTAADPVLGPIVTVGIATMVAPISGIGLTTVIQTPIPPAPVRAGDTITYHTQLKNSGGPLTNVLFQFIYPEQTTLVDIQSTFTTGAPFTPVYSYFTEIPVDGVGATSPPTMERTIQAIASTFPTGGVNDFYITVRVKDDTPTSVLQAQASVTTASGTDSDCTLIGVNAPVLKITKFDVPDPVFAGNQITYTLEVSNIGDTDISDVVFTDPLPPFTTFVSAMQTSGPLPLFTLTTPLPGTNGTITGTRAGSYPAGALSTFTIVVDVDPSAPVGTINNRVCVSGVNPTQSVCADDFTTILRQSLLTISKIDTPDPVAAGNQLLYTINLANNGPSDAVDVTLTDILPPESAFVSIDQTGKLFDLVSLPSDSGPGGNFVAHVDRFAVNDISTLSLLVTINKLTAPGLITNSATIASVDPLVSNTVLVDTTVVAPTTTLTIIKSSSPNPIVAGNVLTYTVTVSNAGPTDADDVNFTDLLPPQVTLISVCQTGKEFDITCFGDNPGGTIMAHTDTLAVGESTTFTITVLVDEHTPAGIITNNATIASAFPIASQSVMQDTTVIAPSTTLTITKGAIPNPVTAGNILTYTMTVTNTGSVDAHDVTFTDTLPAVVSFVSVTQAGTVFNIVALPTTGSGTFIAHTDVLPAGASTTFVITVQVNEGAPTAPITNVASIQSVFPAAFASVAVITQVIQPSISVTKDGTPNPIPAGGTLTYTVNIVNGSPLAFTGVTITDPLPEQTTFLSVIQVTGPPVTFTTPPVGSSGVVTGTVPVLAGGASIQFVILVNVLPTTPAGDILTNTVNVSTANPVRNVSATSNTTVSGLTNLSVTKTASAAIVLPGDPLVYTVTVLNNGPLDASGMLFQDILPSSLSFVALAQVGVPFTTNVVGNTITATAPTLLAGQSTTFTISTLVNNNAPGGFITNTGTIQSTTPAATASGSVQTQILGPIVDLQITKVGTPNPVFAGGTLTYVVNVINNGPDTANGITFTDILPPSVVFQSITQAGVPFVINQFGNTITGTTGSLTAGESTTFTITVLVPIGTLPGLITNTATIQSNQPSITKSVSINTQVGAQSPGLNISKTASPDPVRTGDLITYTVTVLNGGPGDITNVTFTDVLPPQVSFVSIEQTGTPFNLTSIGGVITAFASLLPLNAFTTFTIIARVNQNVAGLIENIATAQSGATTVQAVARTNVVPMRNLSIFAQCDRCIAKVGQETTLCYTVTNNGFDDLSSIEVFIDLPFRVCFARGFGDNWVLSEHGCGVLAHKDFLAAGCSSQFEVTLKLSKKVSPLIVTTARIADSDSAHSVATLCCPVALAESCLSNAVRTKQIMRARNQNIEISGVCGRPVRNGEITSVQFIATNTGDDDVHEITVMIEMPQGVQAIEIEESDWRILSIHDQMVTVIRDTPLLCHESCPLTLLVTFQGEGDPLSLNRMVATVCSCGSPVRATGVPVQCIPWQKSSLTAAIKEKYCFGCG